MIQPDLAEHGLRAVKRVCTAEKFKRQRDVLDRRHGRDEVKLLKHDADIFAANARQGVLAERAEIMSGDLHLAG